MQLPVMYVEGPQPDWWLWDSHEASDAEAKASSWSSFTRVPGIVERAYKLGTLIP